MVMVILKSNSTLFNTLSARTTLEMDGLENLKSNFKKFDGIDFGLWKDKVQAALKAGKCVEAIKQEFKIKVED